MLLSTTQRWPTRSFSGRMLRSIQWQKRGFKLCPFKTGRSLAQQWDPPRAPSRLRYMLLLLCSTAMSQTSIELMKKCKKHNSLRTQSLSWGHPRSSGTQLQKWILQSAEDLSLMRVTIPSRAASASPLSQSRRKESGRWGGRTDGTLTSSRSQSSTNRFTPAKRLALIGFDKIIDSISIQI